MYQSELCEARKRGRIVSSEPMFVGVGIVIAYFFDYGMSFVGGMFFIDLTTYLLVAISDTYISSQAPLHGDFQ